MLPLHRTPFWTLARRRRFLASFRSDLVAYFAAVTYEAFPFRVVEGEEALRLRRSLEARSPRCRRILAAAETVPIVRHASGDRLGEVTRIDLVDAAFQLDRFDLTREDLLRMFDSAEAVHARAARAARLRVLNPLHWLDLGLSLAEVVPFLPLRWVGVDAARAALTPAGAWVRGGVRILTLVALGWGLLATLGIQDEAASLTGALITGIAGKLGGSGQL